MIDIQPGWFAVVNTGTTATPFIEFAEWLNGEGFAAWDHAVICSRIDPVAGPMIVEAMPSGAKEVPWHYEERPHRWSAEAVHTVPEAGEAARAYINVGYSWLDYEALALHRLHIPAPGLQHYIASTHHLICSQLVDQSELDAGVHLYADGRWPGYVTPQSLGILIAQAGK